MMIYLIPVLTALTLLAAAAAFYQIQVRRGNVSDRLRRVVDGGGEEPEETHTLETADAPLPFFGRLVSFLGWLLPGQIFSETLQWELAQAGYRNIDSRKVFAGARVLCMLILGLSTALICLNIHRSPQETLTLTLLGVVVGYYLPMMFVRSRQSKRQMEITLSLPDALDLLVICVEAGQGLNAALLKVGRETELNSKALSEELRTVNNEMRAGITRTQALRNFALRTGVDEVRALVAVMIQSDRFGTSIAKALRTHAESLRTRRRQRAEETARKAPVKLVFPLVFCIFPELLVVILAPGMLQLFRALSKMVE
ncbi:MAG: type II secretion system F family protein [Candidatus Latescibacterota bacterium]|nr:MAG: type II secretion system F family protein [Candidatus Latescibacterota bacterium]